MVFWKYAKLGALALGLALATPVAAQQAIPLDPGEAYTHPHSGIGVPAELGGFPRTTIVDYASDALDVGMNFENADRSQVISVYVFRNTNGSVPLWFAQAQEAIESQDHYDNPEIVISPEAFAPAGQEATSALRVVYEPGPRNGSRSTGIAMFAVGDWYVKMRASSATHTPDGLSHWMETAIAELQLPEHDAAAAAPITDCDDRLRFRGQARDFEADEVGSAVTGLLGSLLGAQLRDELSDPDAEPAVFCRDSALEPTRIVYRANGSETAYLLALGDNGNSISVSPDSLSGLLGDDVTDEEDVPYAIRLITAGRTYNLVAQDRLPSPRRVMDLLDNNRIAGSATTWGEDRGVEVNMGSK